MNMASNQFKGSIQKTASKVFERHRGNARMKAMEKGEKTKP
jgi:hypothetical protein